MNACVSLLKLILLKLLKNYYFGKHLTKSGLSFHYVAQAGLKSQFSCFSFLMSGILGMSHHVQCCLDALFYFNFYSFSLAGCSEGGIASSDCNLTAYFTNRLFFHVAFL